MLGASQHPPLSDSSCSYCLPRVRAVRLWIIQPEVESMPWIDVGTLREIEKLVHHRERVCADEMDSSRNKMKIHAIAENAEVVIGDGRAS